MKGAVRDYLEDDIIDMLPPTMRAGGQVYTPYSCLAFDIRADGTAATDIEHIVALAEAHDSRIADVRRRDIAAEQREVHGDNHARSLGHRDGGHRGRGRAGTGAATRARRRCSSRSSRT